MGNKRRKPGDPEKVAEYAHERDDHKVVGVREVDKDATPLRYAYDLRDNKWDRYTLKKVSTPPKTHLFNFTVPVGKLGTLLVLDNYGDEWMPDKIRKQTLNTKMFNETIGILHKTGEIVRVGFIKEHTHRPVLVDTDLIEEFYSLTFWDFGNNGAAERLYLPKAYMNRLGELSCKKRPFAITLWDLALYSFVTRWAGYSELAKNLTIDFDFDGPRLQVWGDSWREVTDWKHHDNPVYKGK